MYESGAFVEDGGLIGYGVDRNWRYQRAAVFVEKIFRGAKPADLPVEQPTKFELVHQSESGEADRINNTT